MKIKTYKYPIRIEVIRDKPDEIQLGLSLEAMEQFRDLILQTYRDAVLAAMDKGEVLPRRIILEGNYIISGQERTVFHHGKK